MKPCKEPLLNTVNLGIYSLLISLLVISPFLAQAPVVHAEALVVTAAAPTIPTIIGGQPAEVGEWPWQAMVMAGANFCGGTLIHTEWILTAAHCVYDTNQKLYPTDALQVILGDYYLYTHDDSEQQFIVDRVLVHPDVNLTTYDNDIALLHLTTPAVINRYVAPIVLPSNPEAEALVTPGALAVVIGWGATKENAGLAPVLREVEVPFVANADCRQSYGLLTANMLCAGYPEGSKDACQGDSGGPLMVPDQTGNWKLVGLVSFGYGCGRPLFYGVYTRVANYRAWVEGITGRLETPRGVTEVEATVTPTVTVTVELTSSVTPEATTSPTPLPPTPMAPLPSPTQAENYLPPMHSFLPLAYR